MSRLKFSTYQALAAKIKHPPRSVFDPNAHKLIMEVIDNKNYPNALQLVKAGKVHPDGHDSGENTLLTECVKRGTVKDVEFAIDTLGASLDTSCDCPIHNTALHYAASRGDKKITEALLKRKATVNLINSRGQTALDMAIENKNVEQQKLLAAHGGQQHVTLDTASGSWARMKGKFIGYKPDDRILLLRQTEENNALKIGRGSKSGN